MIPVDQTARQAAATNLDTTFFVEAAAGTGKTTALVARILEIVTKRRARLHEVVAITFTEKAAGELKQRVREELETKLTGNALCEALSDLERAHITTIHSFCASLLRERPVEAVVDPQFAVADALQQELLFEESWAAWLEAQLAQNPAALRHALMREVPLNQLAELAALLVAHRDQLAAGRWPEAEAFNLKSTIERLRDAAPSLERCLKHTTDPTGNFHLRIRTLLDVLPQFDTAVPERAMAVIGALEVSEPRRKADFDGEETFAEAKKLAKELKPVLAEFATAAEHNFLIELVAWLDEFVGEWQRFKHTRAVLDFDDLLVKTRDLLRDNTAVRGQLQKRYRFLLVDEFQDTDPVQTQIVQLLGENTPGKLFIVGDPKQSIYGFRRADIEMYAATQRTIVERGKALVFNQNFRSRSTILDWVNDVFSKLIIRSTGGDYQPDYVALAPCEKFKVTQPAVTLLRPAQWTDKQKIEETRRAEAAGIARHLRGLVDAGECRWADVALLFRGFSGLEVFLDTFQELGVPFRVVGGKGYYQRQEIRTLISLLCALDNPNDKLNLVAVLRSPLFGWTDEQIFMVAASTGLNYLSGSGEAAFSLLSELHGVRHDMSVAAYVEQVMARTHLCQAFFAVGPTGRTSVANLLKALELARALEAAGVRSLRGFVRRLRATIVGGMDEEPAPANEESDDVVQLLTMHKSKGLQFTVVVLADLAGKSSDNGARLIRQGKDNVFQLRFAGYRTVEFDEAVEAQEKRDEAEEIRLLYVAATRAQQRLIIPWFKEKGERLDLLRRGFEPEKSELMEVDCGGQCPPAVVEERTRGSASLRIEERRTWQRERQELLARASQPVARVSPSKLGGELEPREEEPAGIARLAAMELGVTVHEALERGDAAGLEGKALAMVERALGSELMARVKKADEVYRELPFTIVTDAGLMEGKMDLLFREGDRWTLVDYKTDARPEPEKYRAQMAAYAEALERTAGVRVSETLLYFLGTGKIVSLT